MSEGTMMCKISEYCEKYNIKEEGKSEMLKILNESIIEISNVILSTSRGVSREVCKKRVEKRYKSKRAEEYAMEHGLKLEEFEMDEVSKKDVEIKVRDEIKKKNIVDGIKEKVKEKEKEEVEVKVKTKERVICSGINKRGEACKSVGTICPVGSKKKYCFRHSEDWKSFECDTDSSDEEEKELEEEEKELEEEELE